jgi:putative hemolysin
MAPGSPIVGKRNRVPMVLAILAVLAVVAAAIWWFGIRDGETAGVPNPAAVFCEEQGGTVEIVTDAQGNQSGICGLPDGTEIEEWEFYGQFHGESSGAGLANPAAVFCEEQGGIVSGVEPMCELPDGTMVDAWDYFRTQNQPGP